MTNASIHTKSSDLEEHKKLVQLIAEEGELLQKETSPDIIKRHIRILDYLISLQIITSRRL